MAKQEPKKKPETVTPEEETAETAAAEVTETEQKLQELENNLKDANDKFLRTLAEYDNYRKRSVREKEQAYADSKASVLSEILPVLDNFERAAGNRDASLEDYQKGIDMIFKQFQDILTKLGVESFGEKGDAFDPNLHSAVMHTEEEGEPENAISEVFSKGYKLGDKILRPAVVKVVN
jgi:molecular chaperone GrpE